MVERGIIESVRRYIFLLKSEGIGIDKAFVYGSQLTDKKTEESDIDVMIITEEAGNDFLTGKIWSLTRKVNSRIEPFIVPKSKFYSNDDSPLIHIVKTTGIEI
ncbi:MAG: nucleotidyltransferase domain-containing protein [Petrimonas sp.]|nr:nucleotidyltransferase domain-containing protein [Petrimonas sp.]